MAHIRVISSCNWITITILSKKCPTLKPIMEVENSFLVAWKMGRSRDLLTNAYKEMEREREKERENKS